MRSSTCTLSPLFRSVLEWLPSFMSAFSCLIFHCLFSLACSMEEMLSLNDPTYSSWGVIPRKRHIAEPSWVLNAGKCSVWRSSFAAPVLFVLNPLSNVPLTDQQLASPARLRCCVEGKLCLSWYLELLPIVSICPKMSQPHLPFSLWEPQRYRKCFQIPWLLVWLDGRTLQNQR